MIAMSQLLLFTFVAFWLLRGMLHGTPTITLDTDWFYRIPGKKVIRFCEGPLMAFTSYIDQNAMRMAAFFRTLPQKSPPVVENRIDNAFHYRLPALLNFENIYNTIKKAKDRELSFNLIYVLCAMLLLFLFILFGVVVE